MLRIAHSPKEQKPCRYTETHWTNLPDDRGPGRLPRHGPSPAAEYTFAVSDDDSQTFRNPSDQEREELEQAVRNHPECCLNRSEECPWRD